MLSAILSSIWHSAMAYIPFLLSGTHTRLSLSQLLWKVQSFQGREFVNRVNEELFKLCSKDHRIHSAYHLQSNGLDERMNQTLTRAFVKFVNDNQLQDDWDVHIKSILFAYRTCKNDSTKFTPFELIFGRAPVLPIEMEIRSKPSSTDSFSDKVEDAPSDFNDRVLVMMNIRDQVCLCFTGNTPFWRKLNHVYLTDSLYKPETMTNTGSSRIVKQGEGSGNAENCQSSKAAKEVVWCKAPATKIQGGRHCWNEDGTEL